MACDRINAVGDIFKTITVDDKQIPIPDPVTDMYAFGNSPSSIILIWSDPGLWAWYYEVLWATQSDYSDAEVIVNVDAAPTVGAFYEFTGLPSATTYYFRVRARNKAGASADVDTNGTTL